MDLEGDGRRGLDDLCLHGLRALALPRMRGPWCEVPGWLVVGLAGGGRQAGSAGPGMRRAHGGPRHNSCGQLTRSAASMPCLTSSTATRPAEGLDEDATPYLRVPWRSAVKTRAKPSCTPCAAGQRPSHARRAAAIGAQHSQVVQGHGRVRHGRRRGGARACWLAQLFASLGRPIAQGKGQQCKQGELAQGKHVSACAPPLRATLPPRLVSAMPPPWLLTTA